MNDAQKARIALFDSAHREIVAAIVSRIPFGELNPDQFNDIAFMAGRMARSVIRKRSMFLDDVTKELE